MGSAAPDELVFRQHLAGPRFCAGVERGKWRLVGEVNWPYAVVAVAAARRGDGPSEFFLRFDAAGYPEAAPTATPWDPELEDVLAPALRPRGDRVGHVFRSDWNNGQALYAPFDRVALESHDDWRRTYPRQVWDSQKDLAWILETLHELLNDAGYTGV